MSRYACLLRGVNVGGARKLNMSKLRDLCEKLGHTKVETYLQSGNVVFTSRTAQSKLGASLSQAIAEEFGYGDAEVLVWSASELDAVIKGNPLSSVDRDPSRLHVTFLGKDVKPADLEALGVDRFLPDEFAAGSRVVYVYCPGGYGRTKINNSFFERKLGVVATTRNWQTTNKLRDMACAVL